MKRAVKKVIIFLAIIIFLFGFMIVFSRYGWKLFGFMMCDSPNEIFADNITVEDDEVNLRLNEVTSISSYAGYIYKIEDGNLYIGIKHNILFAALSGNIDYNISIHTKDSKIRNIYFKDNQNIWLIWNESEGRIKHSDIKPQKY